MKLTWRCSSFLVVCLLLWSCGESTQSVSLDDAPVVAKKVMVDGEELIDLDLALLKDTLVFPLSHFAKEMEIVKLDDAEEALIGGYSSLVVSENYILTRSYNVPMKLFTIQGDFVATIGAIGQGPGEYRALYDLKINEKKQRIYAMEYRGTSILSYDFSGKFVESIPLVRNASKGRFIVNDDHILVLSMYNPKEEGELIWAQDFKGNLLYEVASSRFDFPMTFSDELFVNNVDGNLNYHFWIWRTVQDSLYHVDLNKKRLIPRFTMTFKGEVKSHIYQELPQYFMGNTSMVVTESWVDEDGKQQMRTIGDPPAFYIVDKKSLKGAYFKIVNDYFGDEVFNDPLIFSIGMYAASVDPGDLTDRLEKLLMKTDLSDSMRKKLTDLLNGISENDNNYVMYAILK